MEKFNVFIKSNEPLDQEQADWMLANIGNLNPDIRDAGIFEGWYQLLKEKRIPNQLKVYLLEQSLTQDFLFKAINEKPSDAVFTRSFTSLLLKLLLSDHYQTNWLSQKQEQQLLNKSLDYFLRESDNRGFVEEKGWAHAFAHGADLLERLIASTYFGPAEMEKMLQGIKRALVTIENFLYGEENRLVKPYIALLSTKQLSDEASAAWLSTLGKAVMEKEFNLCYTKFCMILSFELKCKEMKNPLTQQKIAELMRAFYQKYATL